MTRCVIIHDEMGIFVGVAMGFAFWSKMDAAGQHTVASFADEDDACDFANDVFAELNEFFGLRYVTVESDSNAVDVASLTAAGLGQHIGNLAAYEYH